MEKRLETADSEEKKSRELVSQIKQETGIVYLFLPSTMVLLWLAITAL